MNQINKSHALVLLVMAASICRILTWNVRGIMSSAGSLSKLLDTYNIDFAFISEHKLRKQHDSFLDSVHSNYRALTLCDSETTQGARCGKDGVAIMYKRTCQFSVTPLDIHVNDRILGVKIDCNDALPIYAFSVYMPSVNYPGEDFRDCFALLQILYDTFSAYGTVLFLGDFNCDINKGTYRDERFHVFKSFLDSTCMFPVPLEGSCTFRPTGKILDYILLNNNKRDLIISNTAVDKDICTVSDHLPIISLLKTDVVATVYPNNLILLGTNAQTSICLPTKLHLNMN